MVSYKLVYFDARGRAELSRLIMAESGVTFEDKRVSVEEWPKIKQETPFGLLPLLFVDGKPLGQSMVIVRFLARQFNMEPDNCEGAAFIDAMVCTLDEQVFKLPFMEKNEEKKAELTKKVVENLEKVFKKLEEYTTKTEGPYFIGKTFCYGDLAIMNSFEMIEKFDKNFAKQFPRLTAVCREVCERPNIKKYLESRPQSKF